MKIAHIVSTFFPHLGGMGEMCLSEVQKLSNSGLDAEVFTLSYPRTNYQDEKFSFKINRLKTLFKFGDAGWLINLQDLQNFDIVHFHFPFYGAERAVIKAKKKYGFKLIVTYHMDAQVKGFKKIIRNLIDFFYGKKLFEIADKVIYIDEEKWHSFKFYNEIIKLKSFYLPNAINTDIFKPRITKVNEVGLDKYEGKKIALFVGNLLPVKNLEVLIEAFQKCRDDVILLIVGGGYAEKKYKKIVKKSGLEDKIIFYGRVDEKEKMVKIYNLASVVCISSIYESFSLCAIEALACGIPVIGSNIPGVRGRIANGVDGILLTKNNAEMWKDAIESVVDYDFSQREIIREKAVNKIKNNYSLSAHLNKLLEIYNS